MDTLFEAWHVLNLALTLALIAVLAGTGYTGWIRARRVKSPAALYEHRRWGNKVLIIIVMAVGSVELYPFVFHHRLHTLYGLQMRQIHKEFFVLPFVVFLAASRFWITGKRYPRAHKWVAYPCLAFGIATAVMGAYLNWLLAAGL